MELEEITITQGITFHLRVYLGLPDRCSELSLLWGKYKHGSYGWEKSRMTLRQLQSRKQKQTTTNNQANKQKISNNKKKTAEWSQKFKTRNVTAQWNKVLTDKKKQC